MFWSSYSIQSMMCHWNWYWMHDMIASLSHAKWQTWPKIINGKKNKQKQKRHKIHELWTERKKTKETNKKQAKPPPQQTMPVQRTGKRKQI